MGPAIARQIALRNPHYTDEEKEAILADEWGDSDRLADSPSTLPEGASRYEVIGRLGALVEAGALSETQFNEEKQRLLEFEEGLVDDSDLTEFEKVVELWQSGHLTSEEFEGEKSRLMGDEPGSEAFVRKAGRSTAGDSKPVRNVSRPKRRPRADLFDDSHRLTRSPGESSEVLERHGDPPSEARTEARRIFKRWIQLARRW